MNLTVSNTNRILRSGNGPTVEYTGQDPIQVNNATHIISLNSAFSAQFAESGVEAKVDELSSCCEQVHSSISSLETQVSSLETQISAISSEIPDTSDFITKASADTLYQPIGDYLTHDESGAFQPAGDYLLRSESGAFQPSGDYLTVGILNTLATKQEVRITSGFIQGEIDYISGAISAYPNRDELIEGDYIKLTDNSANHTTEISVTGLPNFNDFASKGDLNALSSLVDSVSSNVSSISSTVSSSVTSLSSDIAYVSAHCLTGHQSLDDYYKKTETSSKQEISAALASIQPGDAEVQQVVRTYSAEGKWLIASDLDPYLQKSESGVFQPSGNYLSANALEGYATEQWVNDQGFIKTETDWTNTIKEASANAYNEAVAQIPAPFDPTFLSGEVDKKLDKSFSSNFYPMTGNPSGFLTAHQPLTDYAKASALNFYLTNEVANELSSKLSDDIQYVSANCLTAETDWTNTITAASSYAYSQAVGQIPEVTGFATKDELTGYESKINWSYVEV